MPLNQHEHRENVECFEELARRLREKGHSTEVAQRRLNMMMVALCPVLNTLGVHINTLFDGYRVEPADWVVLEAMALKFIRSNNQAQLEADFKSWLVPLMQARAADSLRGRQLGAADQARAAGAVPLQGEFLEDFHMQNTGLIPGVMHAKAGGVNLIEPARDCTQAEADGRRAETIAGRLDDVRARAAEVGKPLQIVMPVVNRSNSHWRLHCYTVPARGAVKLTEVWDPSSHGQPDGYSCGHRVLAEGLRRAKIDHPVARATSSQGLWSAICTAVRLVIPTARPQIRSSSAMIMATTAMKPVAAPKFTAGHQAARVEHAFDAVHTVRLIQEETYDAFQTSKLNESYNFDERMASYLNANQASTELNGFARARYESLVAVGRFDHVDKETFILAHQDRIDDHYADNLRQGMTDASAYEDAYQMVRAEVSSELSHAVHQAAVVMTADKLSASPSCMFAGVDFRRHAAEVAAQDRKTAELSPGTPLMRVPGTA